MTTFTVFLFIMVIFFMAIAYGDDKAPNRHTPAVRVMSIFATLVLIVIITRLLL